MLEKQLVKKILEQPLGHDWSIQGLGMLRLYLDDTHRMHIWDHRYQVPNVSKLHTHPWNFKSTIIAGQVTNTILEEAYEGTRHYKQSIFCGVGGGLVGESETVYLKLKSNNKYFEGDSYSELAHEIHLSQPVAGSVTIIKREYLDDADHALVFWEDDDLGWVSAEPRKATDEEVLNITKGSLEKWF